MFFLSTDDLVAAVAAAAPEDTWTSQKSNFTREFTGKMPCPKSGTLFVRACAIEMHLDVSQEQLYAKKIQEKCRESQRVHLDLTRP